MKRMGLAAGCLMAISLTTGAGLTTGASLTTGPGAGVALAAVRAPVAPSAARARPLPVAYDCLGWHRGQVRAPAVAISCFGTVVVTVASWAYWTGVSARSARATLRIDTCKPTCETGRFRKYAATVVFYRVRAHDGVRYYSRFRLRYRHSGARGYTYRWARYPGATIPVWVGGPSGRSSVRRPARTRAGGSPVSP
jgi:hypothetical protein